MKMLKNNRKLDIKYRFWIYNLLLSIVEFGSLNDGISVAIKKYSKQKDKKSNNRVQILRQINLLSGSSGHSLSEALKRFVPMDEFLLISAFEKTGQLHVGLKKILSLIEEKKKRKKDIRSIIRSICMNILIVLILITVIGYGFLNNMSFLLKEEDWPEFAKITYSISLSIKYWGPLFLVGVLAVSILIFKSFDRLLKRPIRTFLNNHIHPWKINRDIVYRNILNSYSAFLNGGLNEYKALKNIDKLTKSPYVKRNIRLALLQLKTGKNNPFLNNPLVNEEINDLFKINNNGFFTNEFYEKLLNHLDESINSQFLMIKNVIKYASQTVLTLIVINMMIIYSYISFSTLKF